MKNGIYIETGSTDPCYNLAFEEYVLEHKKHGDWLMLWQNENTVVVGLNQNAAGEIDPDFVRERGITVVRRRTGGGAVYHDLGNLNCSFITDLGDAERLVISVFTEPVCRALGSMGIVAETTGRNDITVDGKKVSGVAQRIAGGRILHHGTLLFDSDLSVVSRALRADPEKFTSKSAKSVRSRVANIRELLPEDMTLSEFWARIQRELAGEGFVRGSLTEEELSAVCAGAERYRSWEWTYGRSPESGYVNKKRFPGGTLEVRLDIKNGLIESAAFLGDFMAASENSTACLALRGTRYAMEDAEKVLAGLELAPMFGAITLENILDTMFAVE